MKNNFLYIRVKNEDCWKMLEQIDYKKYGIMRPILDEGDGKFIIRDDWECRYIKKLMKDIIQCAGRGVLAVTGTVDTDAKSYTYELFMGEFYTGKNGDKKASTYGGEGTVTRRKYNNIREWISKEVFKIDKEAEVILNSFGVYNGWDMPFEYQKLFVTAADIEDFDLKGKKVAFTGTFKNYREKLEEFVEKKGGKVVGSISGTTDLLVVGLEDGFVLNNKKFLNGVHQNDSEKSADSVLPLISEHEFMAWKKMKAGGSKKKNEKNDGIAFGRYMQKTGHDACKEPIEWIVLKEEKTKLLVISKYILDVKLFIDSDMDDPAWDESFIRSWLNGEFMQTAFTAEEQDRIIKTKLSNKGTSYKYCGDTEDFLFLLRDADLKKYFPSSSDAIAIGTEWAFEKGTKLTDEELGCFETDKEELIGCWRLRTGGMYNANYVNWAGFKDDEMGSWEPLGVRPVMWLKK